MVIEMTDFQIRAIDGFHVAVIPSWRSYIFERELKRLGRPIRYECADLWIVSSDLQDAIDLAKMVSKRHDIWNLTTRRAPTFVEAVPQIPDDVAYYFSGTAKVDDHAILRRLHPAPPRLNERLHWGSGKYELRSAVGYLRISISSAPTTFARNLEAARQQIVDQVGLGFDDSLDHLNCSPVLKWMLSCLTRPAAELASHWMGMLGEAEIDRLVIPERGIVSQWPIGYLQLESKGINRRACFHANVGSMRITDVELSGITLPDTAGHGLDAIARRGELRLSQIVDLPGSDCVPVTSLINTGSSWTANLEQVSTPLSPPVSDIAFDGTGVLEEFERRGDEVTDDVAHLLRGFGRERAEYILHGVADGSSGTTLDISAWMPGHMPTTITLRDRLFERESLGRQRTTEIFGDDR